MHTPPEGPTKTAEGPKRHIGHILNSIATMAVGWPSDNVGAIADYTWSVECGSDHHNHETRTLIVGRLDPSDKP
jgi:hypothetical protein